MAPRPAVLTIAGSDSGGCAGIQADLKTFAAFGVHGLSAITAITAQTMRRVESIHALPAGDVAAQMQAALGGFRVAAAKIGMLASGAIIDVVADRIGACPGMKVVLDPVLASSSGTALLRPAALERLRRRLLPLATVLTPNVPEAEALLGRRIRSSGDLAHAARDLLDAGPRAVLIKGGHLRGAHVRDVFVAAGATHEFVHARLPWSARGTGCTLAAAIAAGLARGSSLARAVADAERFLQAAMQGAYLPAPGNLRTLDPTAAAAALRQRRLRT